MTQRNKPDDSRGFVHKRIFGAITGTAGALLSGGNPLIGAGRGFAGGGGRRSVAADLPVELAVGRAGRRAAQASHALHGHFVGQSDIDAHLAAGLTGTGATPGCAPGTIRDQNGLCVSPGSPGDRAHGGVMVGEAVMGRHGAALVPADRTVVTRDCLPGMVLGNDGLCYNKGSIPNRARMYPKGTRPLGTPGEMAALRKAASFGRRMETTVKRMQKIGVMKKPHSHKRPAQRRLASGGPSTSIVNVD